MKLTDENGNMYEFVSEKYKLDEWLQYGGLLKPIEKAWPQETATIVLTSGAEALVDHEDYDRLKKYTWVENDSGYAVRYYYDEIGTHKSVRMHREVMNYYDDEDIDHINRDKLDNRKENLRVCSRQENMFNVVKKKTAKSKTSYKGVNFDSSTGKWQVKLKVDGKMKTICRLNDDIPAALVYDYYCLKERGEFAVLNFPDLPKKYLKAWKALEDKK